MAEYDIYTRRSKFDGGTSAASQEADLRYWLGGEGHRVSETFSDPDRSASRYARKSRPGYAELVARILAGDSPGVALWESSRGSRNLSEWIALLEACRDQGILIAVRNHERFFDVRKRQDWKALASEGVESHDESEKIAERVRRGKQFAASRGLPAGRNLYGYRRIYDGRGRYVEQVEHPEQAAVVREIARRLLEGGEGNGTTAIARDLNARGIPTSTGVAWRPSQLKEFITNPGYAGLRVHQDAIVGNASWGGLIDPDQHDALVALFADPRRRKQNNVLLTYMLTAVPICGECGAVLRAAGGRTRTRPNPLYRCSGCGGVTVVREQLEKLVVHMVRARLRLLNPGELFARPSDDIALARAKREVAKLQARIDEHKQLSIEGKIPPTMLAEIVAELTPMIRSEQARVKELTQPPPVLGHLADVDLDAEWDNIGVAMQRAVIQMLCEIRVDRGRPGLPYFDKSRIGRSRFRGDDQTWGQKWAQEEAQSVPTD